MKATNQQILYRSYSMLLSRKLWCCHPSLSLSLSHSLTQYLLLSASLSISFCPSLSVSVILLIFLLIPADNADKADKMTERAYVNVGARSV